ncbi:MAG: enoyl-CoA hydratase-related protein [Actinomycetota bacterium]|nr:enoyl-CoA hydratase-related protein [Actinomycetota bacterium]
MSDSVLYAVSEGVATITLNRPEALNAATNELKEALQAALAEAREDDRVRALLLTGAGRAFCAGQDLKEVAAADMSGAVRDTLREHYNPIILGMTSMPKPIVAAVNGIAAGAGASLAFAADFRLAAEEAAFLLAFARIGLTVDAGASWTLQRLVGYSRALAISMLAEPVSARQALEMGLVNGVVPGEELMAAAGELAARLAAGPTRAYAAIKESLGYAATSDLAAALEKEADLQALAAATDDAREAVSSFVAKRPPTFSGR